MVGLLGILSYSPMNIDSDDSDFIGNLDYLNNFYFSYAIKVYASLLQY